MTVIELLQAKMLHSIAPRPKDPQDDDLFPEDDDFDEDEEYEPDDDEY